MNIKYFYQIAIFILMVGCSVKEENAKVKLMTLDPGHFHAALKLPMKTLIQLLMFMPLKCLRLMIF